ncbi:MAG: HopJ type III effector protein [Moraxellaceae bacterium]|nr:HopJ type III effector protein [Moraxellaceae bacterium]MDP1775304.1 HopJ type III effector protein [Moraxellaceae bacterium]MDZ4297863.1 HopJ type III effector protein [Moraxellaceae bacterium]MDZ4386455.1 HopJ type III effector protein [Moraxellaceae bacterium]
MTLNELLTGLRQHTLDFEDAQAFIATNYQYQPVAFQNGNQHNAAGSNEGSCRIFAFGLLNELSAEDILLCFGRFYRDVLATPDGTDHNNIRQFMQHGLAGLCFDQPALMTK